MSESCLLFDVRTQTTTVHLGQLSIVDSGPMCTHFWGSLDHGVEYCLTKHFFRSHRLISVLGYLQPLYQEHTSLAVLSVLTDCTLLAPCCSPMILFWRDWRFLQALQKKSASHPMSGRELGLPQVMLTSNAKSFRTFI